MSHEGRIGLPSASALYIAAVLGTGILVLPGLAADVAGPASILAVAIVFVISIPLAGTFAALAARFPDAGGVATFVRLALGATAARMTGYWFFFGCGFGAPVVATLGGEYLAAVVGLPREWIGVVGAGFLLVAIGLAWIGLRVSSGVQLGLSALLVVVVVTVVASAVPVAQPANLQPFLPHGWVGVGLAISLFVWAFAGWEAITHWAGEFKNPRRTLPLATAIAVIVVGIAYLALQVATVMVSGAEGGSSLVPLIDLVAVTLPGIGPAVVAGIAVIVVLGVLNVYVPAFGNLAASLGRDGDLPRWFAPGAAGGEVPRRGLLLTAVTCLGYTAIRFALDLDLEVFVLIHTSSMVAVYLLGMIAAVRLLDRFSVGWWMAVVSVALVGALVVLAGANLLIPAILAVVALVVGFVQTKERSHA
ncbi:amino acid permease [Pseudolysinimonas sp.]|uniref:APC family permease n=1 Tax=Pseudolysinimonas sp. TaxID=2680009 RepID=UPI00286C55ED|nr:amino acid permease [Pseudolysinimonas sp.]